MPRIIEVVYKGGVISELDDELRNAFDPRPSGSGFFIPTALRDLGWDLGPKDDEKKLLAEARSIVRKHIKKDYTVKIRSF